MKKTMTRIADGKKLETRWQKIRNLKTQASVLMFIQSHNITDMAQLVNTIETINESYKDLADKIRKYGKRSVQGREGLPQHRYERQNRPAAHQGVAKGTTLICAFCGYSVFY